MSRAKRVAATFRSCESLGSNDSDGRRIMQAGEEILSNLRKMRASYKKLKQLAASSGEKAILLSVNSMFDASSIEDMMNGDIDDVTQDLLSSLEMSIDEMKKKENNGEPLFEPEGIDEEDPMIGDSIEPKLKENGDMLAALQKKKEDATSDGANGGEGGIGEKNEGLHFNTRIKALEAHHAPVKVKLGLKECHRMIESILDPGHPSPNPADDESRKILEASSKKLGSLMESMKAVVVRRRVNQ